VLSGVISDRLKREDVNPSFKLRVFPLDQAQVWPQWTNLFTLMKFSDPCKSEASPGVQVEVWLEAGREGR